MKPQLYEFWIDEIHAYARFKSLPEDMIADIQIRIFDLEEEEKVSKVLEYCVFNLSTELAPKIRELSDRGSKAVISFLYNGCIMLNPSLDGGQWTKLAFSQHAPTSEDIQPPAELEAEVAVKPKPTNKKIPRTKFLKLEEELKKTIVGQDEAIKAISDALVIAHAGLGDKERPVGVFMLAGASGIGKTLLAKNLHNYLFGEEVKMVRVDCGEFQHKHENQKLLGPPAGYVGYEDGGFFTKQMTDGSARVVLLDEVEKAHPDIWNTFLRVFDEGVLTDNKGKTVNFRNTVIIMTTNLGNDKVVDHMVARQPGFANANAITGKKRTPPARSMVERETNEAIRKMFKPELLNRVDEVVIFNHLSDENYNAIAELELDKLQDKMLKKKIGLTWGANVPEALVEVGVDAVIGARGLTKARRDYLEIVIARKILSGEIKQGSQVSIVYSPDGFDIVPEISSSAILVKELE